MGDEARDPALIEQDVRSSLERFGVPYEILACDPEFADTDAFCERYGYPPEKAGNTIIVGSRREPKQFAACVLTAVTRLDVNKTVRKLMGVKKLSFASAEDTMQLTGMLLGGVTVFALPADLPVYIDARVGELDWVILGGGSRSIKVKISPRVFDVMPEATVVEGLALDVAGS